MTPNGERNRLPIRRVHGEEVVCGTARLEGTRLDDFRDLAGDPLPLPPGARYEIDLHEAHRHA